MAQADGIVSNASGAAVRADLNNQLAAVFTNHSGPTEPSTTYAYQWWADTTNGVMKLRNAANSAWITMFQLDGEWTSLALENGTAASPSIYFKDSGTDTGVYSPGTDQVGIATAGVQRVNFNAATEVVFNDGGNDVDFRIEGDTEENLFVIDAGTDQVRVKNLNGGPLSGARNRIINGDMRIDQRATTATTTGAYTVDRFAQSQVGGGVISWARSTNAPAGFTNSIGGAVATADSSIASTDFYRLYQAIEGFNIADLGSGTVGAKTITVSFWVRSSVTGTYCLGFTNGSFNRSYATEYSIAATNTWEYKTVTLTLDQSGTWATDNGAGIYVFWDLGSGSSYNSTPNAWTASGNWKTASQTSWIATNGATFYITGVQLEPGTVATPFERRSYGQELSLCQRYYRTAPRLFGLAINANLMQLNVQFGQSMRATPTAITTNANVAGESPIGVTGRTASGGSANIGFFDELGGSVTMSGFSGMTAQNTALCNPFCAFSAEL